MRSNHVLMLTDLVDSTRLAERLGDEAAAAWWQTHDRVARGLLRQWRGREIDKSDGFLLLFDRIEDAVGHALAYHAALELIDPPLAARAGLHCGSVHLRENSVDDIALGAKRLEVEGLAKATAARIMALALGGQTLLSPQARAALEGAAQGGQGWRVQSHGHWRLKGLAEPIELFEVGADRAPFVPPPDSAKAYRVVRADGDWAPVRELPHNLPAERDAFVGRQEPLLALARRLDDGARLVTVLGIGGIGKTRLALRYARAWVGDYAGGAWFCDLSAARSIDGVVHAVAQALDVPLGKADPVQQLGAAIAGRGPCLVILDNFEQVARHAEATLGVWLERGPQARFIATSREVLGIAGEEALVLAPMAGDEAVRLFGARVAAAGLRLAPGGADAASIGPLVDLLDRLPLAIELAAARMSVMPPTLLLQRMGDRFRLLTSKGRRGDRQATLRATLDWSWDLLSSAERSALHQLTVFEGGFRLAAAEAVVDLSAVPGRPWLADVVQALVEKSLLRVAGDGRFDMLRTVQDYAAEQSCNAPPEWPTWPELRHMAMRRHWTFFAAMEGSATIADRRAELDNVIAACRRAAAQGDTGAAVAVLDVVWSVLKLTGPFTGAVTLGTLVLEATEPGSDAATRVRLVLAQAQVMLGRAEAALEQLAAAADHPIADRSLAANLACARGELDSLQGRAEPALQHLQAALAEARAMADIPLQCKVLNALGALHGDFERHAEAQGCYEAALELARRIGDRRWEGGLLGNLAGLQHGQGRLDAAARDYEHALALARKAGDRRWEANTLCNLGLLYLQQDRLRDARPLLAEAAAMARHMGHARLECTVTGNLGLLAEACADHDTAVAHFEAACSQAEQLGDRRLACLFGGYLGRALGRCGRHADAAGRLQAAEQLLQGTAERGSMALLLCCQADAACSSGDLSTAMRQRTAIDTLLSETRVDPTSEFGRAIEALDRSLDRLENISGERSAAGINPG